MITLQITFKDYLRYFLFQGRSSVCLPLQLSPERLAGWEYSVAVFVVLNLAAFLFIMVAYIAIILKVFKSQRRVKAHGESQTQSTNLKRESALARRVFAIILTDFSCWVPVIILSILALVGKFHDPEGVVYVWFAAFVLPVNSSVNPVLYTFSTPKVGWQKNAHVLTLPEANIRATIPNHTLTIVHTRLQFSIIMTAFEYRHIFMI